MDLSTELSEMMNCQKSHLQSFPKEPFIQELDPNTDLAYTEWHQFTRSAQLIIPIPLFLIPRTHLFSH